MSNPKISIISICFNAEKTIEQTVKSVLNQDYPNIEYIIIDGDSKDSTLNIIKSHQSGISKLISEPDKGLYDALNKGIKAATGDIIGILHSDDFYPNDNVLSHIVNLFEVNSDIGAVSASVKIFKGDQFINPFRTYDATNFKLWQFRFGIQPPHPGFFIKSYVIKNVGLYDVNYKISGDFDWLLRVLKIKKIKTHFTKFIAVYMRDGGLSSSGFKSKRIMNNEDLKSLKFHHIYSNSLFIYCKYFIKIFQINFFRISKTDK